MTSNLVVVAEINAQPGKEAELRALLNGFVEPTRKEAGCLKYDLHEQIDQPGRFFFLEEWSSPEALAAHLQSPHITAALPRVPDLCTGEPRILSCRQIA